MPHAICSWLMYESAILSDGRITTCCVDSLGENAFASIYDHNWHEAFQVRYLEMRKRFAHCPDLPPRCRNCIGNLASKGLASLDAGGEQLDWFLTPEHTPRNLVIEPTSLCNMRCVECVQSKSLLDKHRLGPRGRMIDVPHLMSWIGPAVKNLQLIRLYNYGETFLHPDAIELCSFLTSANPELSVDIATNGAALYSDEKLTQLVQSKVTMLDFSVHGATQDSLAQYMGPRADFAGVCRNMKRLIEIRHSLNSALPYVGWKYLLFEWNDSTREMAEARRMSKEMGVDLFGFELSGGPYASKRYTHSSESWRELVERREFYFDVYWDFYRPNQLQALRALTA